jgi:hypothetical protein
MGFWGGMASGLNQSLDDAVEAAAAEARAQQEWKEKLAFEQYRQDLRHQYAMLGITPPPGLEGYAPPEGAGPAWQKMYWEKAGFPAMGWGTEPEGYRQYQADVKQQQELEKISARGEQARMTKATPGARRAGGGGGGGGGGKGRSAWKTDWERSQPQTDKVGAPREAASPGPTPGDRGKFNPPTPKNLPPGKKIK